MLTIGILWKLTGYSNCLRTLGSAFKPSGCGGERFTKMMPFQRGRRGVKGQPSSYLSRNDYEYEYNDYNEPYDSYGGGNQQHSSAYDDSYDSYGRGNQQQTKWLTSIQPVRRPPVDANCGELRLTDRDKVVHMTGRVQYQRLNRFISLRDSNGTTQLVALEERLDLMKRIRNIPIDSHIKVIGTVQKRPNNTINLTMATGEIEVIIEEIVDVVAPKRKFNELIGEEAAGRTGKKARSSVLITSGEVSRCGTSAAAKRKFQERTHNCGELNESLINKDVILCGWIESKRNERFVVLRDGYGAAQLVINPSDFVVAKTMQSTEQGTLVTVKGKVDMRPVHQRNTRMATGNIEVKVTSMEVVNPFEPDRDTEEVTMELSPSVPPGAAPPGDVNSYSSRTHTCGQLRGGDVGRDVVLCGWLDSQRTHRFAIIRDGHGCTQLLFPTELESTLGNHMAKTTLESVIMVAGTVCARPPEQVTEKVATGEVEVVVKKYSVLNPAKRDLPFNIRKHNRPKENLRMKYRYLDMRFSDMQYRLRLRSQVLMRMREFLINQRGFVEVETPTLFSKTPGGAQEYVVPTRLEDRFYSLVQSPQQLKQLLMVGAMDRYFQVARCYRDEGARPDRQPEFTQMDIEMSFTDRESIITLIEDLLKASWPEAFQSLHTPFPVITYHDAMHWYGTDKPNLAYDKKLVDISELITDSMKQSFPKNMKGDENVTAKALVFDTKDVNKLKESLKGCAELLKQKPNLQAQLIEVKCMSKTWKLNVEKALPFLNAEQLKNLLRFPETCTIVVGVGKENDVLPLLGKLRQDVFSSPTSNFHFVWIVDFPLFMIGDDGKLESAHHPFTSAHHDDSHLLKSNPTKVRGLHFDLVLNGYEVGGGSVRIHDAETQKSVLQDILKIPVNSLEHLLEALASGAPPHGGIALGMDRLLSVMVGAESIRDVIAFPKGVDGKDPLSGAPSPIPDEDKRLYHLLPRLPKQ